MKIFETSTPSGHTLFCDDIRQEVNGKLMFVGVYHGMMYLGAPFPAHIRLMLRIIYQERPGESTEPVEVKIFAPVGEGEPEVQSIPVDIGFREVEVPHQIDNASVFVNAVLLVQLNLALTHPGKIKVRAYRGDAEIRLGSLLVELWPQLEQTPPNEHAPQPAA